MAKKKTNKKSEKAPIENKSLKVTPENKADYKGFIVIDGMRYKMAEAKARLMVKQGKATF